MDSDEGSTGSGQVRRSWADDDEAATWNRNVRMGWQVSDDPLSDEIFYAVRNRDGKTVTAHDRQGLIRAMAVADISSTLNHAFTTEPEPGLPEELR